MSAVKPAGKYCPTDSFLVQYGKADVEIKLSIRDLSIHTDHSQQGWRGLDAACRAASFAVVVP